VILTDAVERYLDGLRPAPDPVLADMERQGEREGIPIVVPATGRLLELLVAATGAVRVVEVGTAIGVSTLYMARALPEGGVILSFEVDAERHRAAREYLDRAGVAQRADLRLQDAREGLAQLEPPFDLAFLDAAKPQYDDYLDLAIPLLRPGGLVVADNALFGGSVVDESGGESARSLRAFNERLLSHPELELGTVLAVGDGVGLAVRARNA
jgi:caffeoyl-CoA O-methyltransferase